MGGQAYRERAGLLLLTIVLAGPAHGESLTCGTLKADSSRNGATSSWTIGGPAGRTAESGVLKAGPRFECIDGAILVMEFTSQAGHSIFEAHFPDGSDIAYGRQQIDRRANRFVLPVQAKARMAPQFRGAFDYHCRLEMPADPISPAMRADCAF